MERVPIRLHFTSIYKYFHDIRYKMMTNSHKCIRQHTHPHWMGWDEHQFHIFKSYKLEKKIISIVLLNWCGIWNWTVVMFTVNINRNIIQQKKKRISNWCAMDVYNVNLFECNESGDVSNDVQLNVPTSTALYFCIKCDNHFAS